ncbi:ABC transporter substrate-binding protein [Helicovermis profundi]|uniref:ABC transporter substrate-binding protein n=1 Tax=Helicovermis profundi TaxID=3065157 RepID=A0AAU9E469_9FIRM|nr:ABC transporter substrate-binding protein [Clostridia bacterium S502]
MKKRFYVLLLILVMIVSFGLTGCSSPATEKTEAPSDDAAKTTETTDTAPAPAKEKVLIFARSGDSVSLDPSNATDGESFYVARNVLDTLVDYAEDSTAIIPALATSWETKNEEGTIWEFHLRKGVKFHDGTDFNADAVVFNFDRWMNEDNEYRFDGENFEYWGYMFGGYPGIVKSVTAVDENTVDVELNTPNAPFISNLAMPSFAISSPTAIKKYKGDIFKNPVGTGPFKFVEWLKDDKIVLEKNENYWGEGPKLDKLIFRSIPDNSARLLELQAGTIDMMTGVSPDDAQIIKDDPNLQLYLRPSMNVGYLAMNMMKKPFDDVRVRQALNYAVDKDSIIKAFYGGLAEPAKNPIPPSLWGYNDDITAYEYNPEKAKALLAEAGYPDGFKTTLWAMPVARPYMPQPKEIATALQQQFAAIGVDAEIVTMDWATYLAKGENGEHDTYLLGWTGDNGDPDNFMYVLLDKDNANVGSAGNVAFYKSEAVHKLLIEAQQESDQAKRAELYKQAQVIIHNDAPWVPLVHSTPPIAAKKSVKNYVPHPTGGESIFWKVDIDNN